MRYYHHTLTCNSKRFIIKSDPEHSEEAFSTFIRLIQEYIKSEVAEMEKADYNGASLCLHISMNVANLCRFQR